MLSACDAVVLNPSGDIAVQQRDIVVISTALMLLVIVPVMVLTVLFAWRYRQSNTAARYEPDWNHSMQLELVIWGGPLLIVACLGALTWMATHLLDPYRPIGRVAAGQQVAQEVRPLEVDVVSLDWKWLFIYPEYGVASVNELAAPVNRPIDFRITSSSVMNSLYIPALAGQVYAMAGMETRLHAVMNKPGVYQGFSANYSGAGFSGMHFSFHSVAQHDFDKWIADVKAAGGTLDRGDYLELARPSENVPVHRYATVDSGLYQAVLNRCVEPGKMCINDMAAIDAKGGLGLQGAHNVLPAQYDKYAKSGATTSSQRTYVASVCTPDDADQQKSAERAAIPIGTSPVLGAGLPRPLLTPIRLSPMSLLLPSNS